MNDILDLLMRAGPRLLLGVSVLLALGTVAAWCCREPLHRQRAAEITVASVLVWLALAFVPRPMNDPPVVREEAAPIVRVAPPLERLATLQRTIELREAQLTSLAAPVPLAAPIDWPRVLVLGWLGSVALGLAWLALGACALVRVLVSATNAPPRVRALVTPFRGKVLVSSRVTRAFCCSFVRDVIVLPHALVADADFARLAAVLDHERAHLEQRDAGGRLLFALALPLLCWHPLYWLLARQASLAAELVADEIAATRTSPAHYARAMIELAAASPSRVPFLLGASPAFCGRSEFYRRMKMLLQRDRRLTVRLSPMRRFAQTGCALLAIGGASAFVGMGELRAQDPAPVQPYDDPATRLAER